MKPLRLMFVCGEPSGDLLGAQLMAALRKETGGKVEFSGVGGEAMATEGFKSLFPLDATSVMGIFEIVPRLATIFKRIRQAVDFAAATRPDAVVLIDSPEFTQRIGKRIRTAAPGVRIITYVAPQVWAMRSSRARKMAKYLDLMLALLPFEPPFFSGCGLRTSFVGHPAVERAGRMKGGDEFRRRRGIAPDAPLLAVLPGSRRGEVARLLPVFREAAARLADRVPGLATVVPLVPQVADAVRAGCRDWPVPIHFTEDEAEKFAAFDAADAALAASGTVTTELALAHTPTVVAYKVNPLTAAVVRRFIRVKYATLTNLILDREVMPEFIQERCKPENLAVAAAKLLTDRSAAEAQAALQTQAMCALGLGGGAPSLRAARAILSFLQEGAD